MKERKESRLIPGLGLKQLFLKEFIYFIFRDGKGWGKRGRETLM